MVGIVIITYNVHYLLLKQVELIRKFCKDEFKIIVIDNSSLSHEAKSIRYHALNLGCEYIRTQASSVNGSDSHAFAANLSYNIVKNDYNYLFYLDHDCFPTKEFSVKEILENKVMAGIAQVKDKKYLWPGCLMIHNYPTIRDLVDFSPCHEFRLDTGGKLYKVIDFYGEENCLFFDEVHVQNKDFNKSMYNFYSDINNGMFMHFINGSNWNESNDNRERINSLLNILETLTK